MAEHDTKFREVQEIEEVLGVRFPQSYRSFLLKQGTTEVGGHRILGLPIRDVRLSIRDATQLLRQRRADLPHTLVAVSFRNDRALCLDLAHGTEEDAPLVDVSLTKGEETLPVTDSFRAFLDWHETRMRDFDCAVQRMGNRKAEFEASGRMKLRRLHQRDGARSTLHSRAQDWHPRMIRFHDDVVALSVFRYSYRLQCLEADVFYAADHPLYLPGEPLRCLLMTAFPEALRLGGSLTMVFTRDTREDERGRIPPRLQRLQGRKPSRVPRPVPPNLVALAEKHGVTFVQATEGKIAHEEAVRLWWDLLELTPDARTLAEEIERAGYLTKEGLATILCAGIWSREEAIWLLKNAPRPEAILLGTDCAEQRIPYAESLAYGCAALVVSRLQRKIVVALAGGVGPEEVRGADCVIEPRGTCWLLSCDRPFPLPWRFTDSASLTIEPAERALVLARPRLLTRAHTDRAWLKEQIEVVRKADADVRLRCLVLSMEFLDLDGMPEEVVRAAAEQGVELLFLPRRLDHYEEEAAGRMDRARRIRKFPPRRAPMKLRVLEAPFGMWKAPGFWDGVRDGETFGRWITKRVDTNRARREFTLNCRTVERIALQSEQCSLLVELDGQESEAVLQALEVNDADHQGIAFSFVPPRRMAEFRKQIGEKLSAKLELKQVKSGLVIAHSAYEQSSARPALARREAPTLSQLHPNFRIPDIGPERCVARRAEDIRHFACQVVACLRSGQPLAVSYLRTELFPEVLRHYLHCLSRVFEEHVRETRREPRYDSWWDHVRAFFGSPAYKDVQVARVVQREEVCEPVALRIVYSDGTEGAPFPLFSLPHKERPTGLYRLKVGLVSMRHPEVDDMVVRYLMRNRELQLRREGSAEQEAFAFHRTIDFITKLLQVLRGHNVETIEQQDAYFRILIGLLDLRSMRAPGCELHIFQTTGLEPATVGVYRAVVEALRRHRGQLVVIPRILGRTISPRTSGTERERLIQESDYQEAQAWY